MERSDEVRDFLSSVLKTFGTERMGSAFSNATCFEPGLLFIGTDASEWWDSPDKFSSALKAQGEELRGASAMVTAVDGFLEGGLGWGAAKIDVDFPGLPRVAMRFTATLARRGEEWKIVQGHVSVGAPNKEVVGKELTV